MISCHALSKSYGRKRVVHHATFDVPAGRITGLLGPNGSGKTTILKAILGLTSASGQVVVEPDPEAMTWASRPVGVAMDITGFRQELRLGDTLRAIGLRHGVQVDAKALLERVGLPDPAQRVGTLSLGMTQRLRIAAALAVPPAALILDEPLNGLDPEGIRWMRRLLREHADRGGAVLFSSHLLNEAERIVDDVVLIHRGHVIANRALGEFVPDGSTLEDQFFAETTHEGAP